MRTEVGGGRTTLVVSLMTLATGPDWQPQWAVDRRARPEDDCLLQLAMAVVARSHGPQLPALLTAAKAFEKEMLCSAAPVRSAAGPSPGPAR